MAHTGVTAMPETCTQQHVHDIYTICTKGAQQNGTLVGTPVLFTALKPWERHGFFLGQSKPWILENTLILLESWSFCLRAWNEIATIFSLTKITKCNHPSDVKTDACSVAYKWCKNDIKYYPKLGKLAKKTGGMQIPAT